MNDSDNDQVNQEEEGKSKQKSRGKKRKRVASESSTDIEDVLPENTLEVEKNLHASAIKNNLDDVSVKKILKKVVTNDHVLALVKLREEEEDSGTEENLQPKITRAKAKELMKVSPKSAPWNLELTPIKHIPVKTRPEVKALIAQELPDDEDDEEYEPTNDDVLSDDDHVLESSSDIDSLPRTPATPQSQKTTPKVVNDGPFKVPQQQEILTPVRRKLVLEEEATIALRTRSKLSLSATSIEHIESSFVPPDDLPMPDVDSLWNNFLKECLNPASNARNEDDDETDPEYNVAADPDANEEDEESLENSIIKISKKELNDLVTELFNIMPDSASEETDNMVTDTIVQDMLTEQTTLPAEIPTHWEGKQEPISDEENTVTSRAAPIAAKTERFSIGKCEQQDQNDEQFLQQEIHHENQNTGEQPIVKSSTPPVVMISALTSSKQKSQSKNPPGLLRVVNKPQAIRVEIQKDACNILQEQVYLLQQQLRQHVQLAASSYLQLYVHPTHWSRAPAYKEFLVSLDLMATKVPTSIVNVCNLRPAIELIASWENAVSTNTKENLEMVKFIKEQEERNRRRIPHHAGQVGDFPEQYMQVVANSSVFLYPHLLPATPFRPDYKCRRSVYLRSEDELITLGMDQFWEYVYANPDLYKRPTQVHPRHRWGLAATLQLVCKHMIPWLTPKTLLGHVSHVRKGYDKDNPIYKFLMTRQVSPVRHQLLPFNPQLTLYEQPEHEVPRIWVRYLAKSSARFKRYLYSRNKPDVTSNSIDIDISVPAANKTPLPIDFMKEINCSRLNLLPKENTPLINRIDVPISITQPNQTLVASQIFTVLSTSNGSFLVPLQMDTKTVNATTTPVCTTQEINPPDSQSTPENVISKEAVVEGTRTAERSNLKDQVSSEHMNSDSEHCLCCVQLRNICKRRRKTILDYFKSDKKSVEFTCGCRGKKYPRITNRLKLLLKNYKTQSNYLYEQLQHNIGMVMRKGDDSREKSSDAVISDDDENDLVTATLFQLKLTTVTAVARNNFLKKRIHTLLSKFDIEIGDVLSLTRSLSALCEVELKDYYREFLGFLTAEQADVMGHFKDYFVQRCMGKLIEKIEELVLDKQKRCSIMWFLKSKFFTTAFQSLSACEICSAMLWVVDGYPELAQYVFHLFPHRKQQSAQQQKPLSKPVTANVETPADVVNEPVEPNSTVDYEADHSSSDDGEEGDGPEETPGTLRGEVVQYVIEHESTSMKVEEENINVNATITEAGNDASDVMDVRSDNLDNETDMSRLIMSDDESIKSECPEWKRDEDKVILEVLKQHITPEERRDKTILDILEETQVLTMITDSLQHKSISDVKDRILYLLQLLVDSDLLQ